MRSQIKFLAWPSYLYTAVLLPAELHLSKLAFANGVSKNEVAKLGCLVASRMFLSATITAAFLWTVGGLLGLAGLRLAITSILRVCDDAA